MQSTQYRQGTAVSRRALSRRTGPTIAGALAGAVLLILGLFAALNAFTGGSGSTGDAAGGRSSSPVGGPVVGQAPATSPRATPTPAHKHQRAHSSPSTPVAKARRSTCGAPVNPWGYNFCGRGTEIYENDLDASVCLYFTCIDTFPAGNGYLVECNDGTYSMSGGRAGACVNHKGPSREVYSG